MMLSKFANIVFCTVLSLAIISCNDDSGISDVQNNGLSKEINKVVPDSVISAFEDIGISINTGDTPPEINGIYKVSPLLLEASSKKTDTLVSVFENMQVEFFNQHSLKISVSYKQGGETGNADSAYIVGADSLFSVFFLTSSRSNGEIAEITHIISGKLSQDGISGLEYAIYMRDNKNNPNKIWIDNKQTRLFKDGDEFSEKVESSQE